LLGTFHTTVGELNAYLMELWGMPAEVVTALSFQDKPQEEPSGVFGLTSALYIANHIASSKAPPDDFGVEEWKTDYLQKIGCQEDVASWERSPFPPKDGDDAD
jgi:hypothetical protein